MKVTERIFSYVPTKFYLNEYGLFYEGQLLECYDYKLNYLYDVIINKFIIHYRKNTKEPYMCFNFSLLGHKQSFTFECEGRLGITYKISNKTIDKIQ